MLTQHSHNFFTSKNQKANLNMFLSKAKGNIQGILLLQISFLHPAPNFFSEPSFRLNENTGKRVYFSAE